MDEQHPQIGASGSRSEMPSDAQRGGKDKNGTVWQRVDEDETFELEYPGKPIHGRQRGAGENGMFRDIGIGYRTKIIFVPSKVHPNPKSSVVNNKHNLHVSTAIDNIHHLSINKYANRYVCRGGRVRVGGW